MEARLQPLQPRGIRPLLLVLVVLLALLAGTAAGYVIKPATWIAGPTHYVVVPVGQATPLDPTSCEFHSGHKGC